MSDLNDRIGTVVGAKYEIQRLIGKGGMGAVYAARQLQLDRQVALKLLRSDVTADEAAVARFHREARAMARIEHPNAVRVYDFGETEDGAAYIVMEFVEGIPLRVMLRRARILPLDVVVEVVWQAAAAVSAAHAQGIVHRDLKPENLIVRLGDDGAIAAKVVDFGLAKLLAGDADQLTSPSEMIGTPRYMAPEQFTGDDLDERVDVYALGVIIFELLAGRPPFEGTFSEVVGKHLHMDPPSFASLGLEAPAGVEVVVRRALAKRPAERPASVADLARQFVRCFGVEAPAGTAIIGPTSQTSRSALLEAFPEGLEMHVPERDAAEYQTRYSERDEELTRLRPATVANVPTESLGSTALPSMTPDRSSRLPLVLGAVAVLALAGVAVAAVGYTALSAYRSRSAPHETAGAQAPAPPPAPISASPAVDAAAESDYDDGEVGSRPTGIPFLLNGRIVIYDDGRTLREGDALEIVDPTTGEAESFPLDANEKRTKWVVKRSARSTPRGRTVSDLVGPNRIVEMRIRHADGTASAPIGISVSDE